MKKRLILKKKLREARAAAKLLATERTAWNTRSIHDRKAIIKRIELQVRAITVHAAKAAENGVHIPIPDLRSWLVRDHNRYVRHIGGQSKYVPHQGAGECARRLRQAGIRAQSII